MVQASSPVTTHLYTEKNLLKRPQIWGSQNKDKRLQPIKTDY